jgi:phage terminase large subunit-like protein
MRGLTKRQLKEETRAERVIRFCETYLVTPEGAHVGKPIRLRDWQREIICQIYDTPTRQAIVSMGRKNGKTALIAMLMLAHLVGPEARRNAQIFSAAQSREQASIIFSLASKMVRMSRELSDKNLVVVRESARELFSPLTGVRYKALAADATTAYGFSPVMVVHDELGQVRGSKSALYDALETAMGAQEEPLSIVISTQAPTGIDLLSLLIDYARTGSDPKTKLVLFETAETDALDDPATWAKANPALGDFLSHEEIRGLAEKAQRMPSFESAFRNLHLNQRVAALAQLFSLSVWEANGGEPDMDAFHSSPVYGGLDLSGRQDLTALVLLAEGPKGQWNVWPHFWTPAGTLHDRAQRDRQPYQAWERDGLLTTVPGVTIDYGFVAQKLGEIGKRCDLRMIRFDRWRIDEFRAAMSNIGVGVELAECGQGFRDMAPALDALETLALQERLRHGMHPVLTMCAANAIVTTDPAGNRKLEKQKSTGRIDGMVALAMAAAAALGDAEPVINVRALIG